VRLKTDMARSGYS